MPADAPIRAALREAANASSRRRSEEVGGCFSEDPNCTGEPGNCECERVSMIDASAAVAAFLRALPERFPMPGEHNPDCQVWGHAKGEMRKLAAAVEAAAAEGEGMCGI